MPALSNTMQRAARPFRWAWSHKRKATGYSTLFVIACYACVFLLVSCATSPTDQSAALSNGKSVAYLTSAQDTGRPGRVVLVHGAPADASSWNTLLDKQRDALPAEAVVIDRLGYGNSSPGRSLALAEQASAVEPFLSPIDGRHPILVGHSHGGPVVLRAAVEYPDRVGGIVLVAGACDPYMKDAQWLRKLVNGVAWVVPEPWEVANAELLALTDENLAMEPMLGRVVCPVVIIHGTWDAVCPHDSTVAYLRSRLVNAAEVRVVSLPRVGHNLQLTHPEVIAEEVRRLLEAGGVPSRETE